MNPVLRLILIGVVLATLVVVAVGFLLPREYTVERRVTINAAPERIHALAGGSFNINSTKQLAEILFENLLNGLLGEVLQLTHRAGV